MVMGILLFGAALSAQSPPPISLPAMPMPPGDGATAIIGSVQREDKSGVIGAIVVAFRTFSAKSTTGRPSKAVFSGKDGSFRIDSLEAGAYTVCADVAGTSLLDRCLWDDVAPAVNLDNGMTIPVHITVKAGAKLHVRVNDPLGAIVSVVKKTNGGPAYLTGVWTGRGTFQPMPKISSDALGDDLEMTVPIGRDLQFVFQPGQLHVSDAQGNLLDVTKGPIIVHLNAGETERVITFTAKP